LLLGSSAAETTGYSQCISNGTLLLLCACLCRSAAAASGLSELDAAAEQLACQATALQAQAAGAEGVEAAEQARAAAAAAEARGLQVIGLAGGINCAAVLADELLFS
jgi:hypothetical protein